MADPEVIMYQGVPCYSFRQLDERLGVAKGHAFRAFKRAHPDLVEGIDYFYLEAEREREFIDALRARGLIYRSSWHLVLVSTAGYKKLL